MKLKILGSSSTGNCYLLENDSEVLMLELGVNIQKIKQALNYNFKKLVGCLVTHEHGDHAKAVPDALKLGFDIYTSRGTMRELGLPVTHHRLHTIEANKIFNVGSFKVWPFKIEHDVAEPLGFIINHAETGNVLFITDSYYVNNRFDNIHNVIIEANYCMKIINERVAAGASPELLRNRIVKSHMSIDTCKRTLFSMDLKKVQKIVLIHLSDGNSHAERFKMEVQQLTGKPVWVADAGMTIENFNKTAF